MAIKVVVELLIAVVIIVQTIVMVLAINSMKTKFDETENIVHKRILLFQVPSESQIYLEGSNSGLLFSLFDFH